MTQSKLNRNNSVHHGQPFLKNETSFKTSFKFTHIDCANLMRENNLNKDYIFLWNEILCIHTSGKKYRLLAICCLAFEKDSAWVKMQATNYFVAFVPQVLLFGKQFAGLVSSFQVWWAVCRLVSSCYKYNVHLNITQ